MSVVVADVVADVEAEEDAVEVCVVDGDVTSQENVPFAYAAMTSFRCSTTLSHSVLELTTSLTMSKTHWNS